MMGDKRLSEVKKQILGHLDKEGYSILGVLGNANEYGYSYSVGLYRTQEVPEMIVLGLPQDVGDVLIRDYAERCKLGECMDLDVRYSDFLHGYDVIFREVDDSHLKEYAGFNNWLYGVEKYRCLQMFFPDKQGLFVWEEGCNLNTKVRLDAEKK